MGGDVAYSKVPSRTHRVPTAPGALLLRSGPGCVEVGATLPGRHLHRGMGWTAGLSCVCHICVSQTLLGTGSAPSPAIHPQPGLLPSEVGLPAGPALRAGGYSMVPGLSPLPFPPSQRCWGQDWRERLSTEWSPRGSGAALPLPPPRPRRASTLRAVTLLPAPSASRLPAGPLVREGV